MTTKEKELKEEYEKFILTKQEYYFREIPKGIFTWKRTCLRFLLMIMIWTISTVTMKIDGGDNVESYRR